LAPQLEADHGHYAWCYAARLEKKLMNDHELGFLQFVLPPQKRRIRTLFELGEKRRREITSLLHSPVRLDPRYVLKLAGGEQFPSDVEQRLRGLGAPDECYVLGGGADIDGRFIRLGDALDEVMSSSNGVFVSCRPGKLGYFEYEHANGGRILRR
jgi:hypothetical protein